MEGYGCSRCLDRPNLDANLSRGITLAITIRLVDSKRDINDFIHLPYRLHKRQPCWVAPLLSEMKVLLDRERNPFYEHAKVEFFLARRNGVVVGRIAAIIDENFITGKDEAVGLFGFFDAIDDSTVARALFNTASGWLREQGMVKMLGPANPSMNDEIGVLVDAFDLLPAIKMVWNPAYYPTLYEQAGFSKAMDLLAWRMTADDISDRLVHIGEKIVKRTKISFRHPNMKKFDDEIKIFRKVYNKAWEDNWGFVAWTEAEFNHVAKGLKQIIDPDLALIAEDNGKPVGFLLALPDINPALKRINGRLFPFGLPSLLWHTRKIKHTRVVIMGVIEEYRNRGIDTALYFESYRIGVKKGIKSAEMSWVLENNDSMNRALKMMGARKYKTYRMYERVL